MREITQTRVGRPAGNCTEACVASILDVDLADVPDLFTPGEDPDSPTFRHGTFLQLHGWLHARGVQWVSVPADPELALTVIAVRYGDDLAAGAHHLLMGKNPDGVGHAVVALAGQMVWDPNPTRRGIVDPDEVVFLVPLDRLPEEQREWPGVQVVAGRED